MLFIRLKPSQVVQAITSSYSALQVDTSFAVLLDMYKKYGRRKAAHIVQMLSSQEYEAIYAIHHLLNSAVGRVTIHHLKRYRNLLRSAYSTSYATISLLGWTTSHVEDDGSLRAFLQERAKGALSITTTHREGAWVGMRIALDDAIYHRTLEQDVDQLLHLL
jgi:hypothetical protein